MSEKLAQYFSSLDRLGVGGVANMYACAVYLEDLYGIERAVAQRVFRLWAATYDQDKPAAVRAATASELH